MEVDMFFLPTFFAILPNIAVILKKKIGIDGD